MPTFGSHGTAAHTMYPSKGGRCIVWYHQGMYTREGKAGVWLLLQSSGIGLHHAGAYSVDHLLCSHRIGVLVPCSSYACLTCKLPTVRAAHRAAHGSAHHHSATHFLGSSVEIDTPCTLAGVATLPSLSLPLSDCECLWPHAGLTQRLPHQPLCGNCGYSLASSCDQPRD